MVALEPNQGHAHAMLEELENSNTLSSDQVAAW